MLTLRDRTADGRDAGFDRRNARRRARDVLFLTDAGIAPDLCEAQRLALVDQAPIGDRELLLKAAQLEVVARHLRRDAHAHIVDVGLEALGVRRSRPHLRADAAEHVDLPEGIEAGAIRRDGTGSFRKTRNRLIPSIDARAGHGRRKAIERDIVEERARLIDPGNGHPHIVIGCQCLDRRARRAPDPRTAATSADRTAVRPPAPCPRGSAPPARRRERRRAYAHRTAASPYHEVTHSRRARSSDRA